MKYRKSLMVTLCVLIFGSSPVLAQTKDNNPKITASTLVFEVIKKKKANPKMTDRQLAAFANQLLAKQGFNYLFNMWELFNQKSPPLPTTQEKEIFINFPFEFTLGNQTQKTFNLTAKKIPNECFSESYPAFPLIKAAHDKATLIVDGKSHEVKIPADFLILTAILVETKTRKKVLQEWTLPYSYGLNSYNFVGLSADGKKLYLKVEEDFENFADENEGQIKELALEISTHGTIKFVPKAGVKRKFKWEYLDDGTELNDALARVTINGKRFILAVPVTTC